MSAPTGKWEKRGGSPSATGAFSHLTPRGMVLKLDIIEKRKHLRLPRQANGNYTSKIISLKARKNVGV